MYKKCYAERLGNNKYKIHLWDEGGYDEIEWHNCAYQECSESDSNFKGLSNEPLKKVFKWDKNTPNLHFHDIPPYQKYLIERYGIDDEPSIGHK